jgi:molybdopterin molybdotransferase
MISVEEAKNIIRSIQPADRTITVPIGEASGLAVAEDIIAGSDIPAFPQSSMDGYAIRFSENCGPLPISGIIPAGLTTAMQLQPGQAMRIFTGAPLPDGADTVIIQERTEIINDQLILKDDQLIKGQHVRPKGAETKKGETAMAAGTYLSPAALGFLAGIGCKEIPVFSPPSVTILLTGDELQAPGQPLVFGQVYDANSFQLKAALQKTGIRSIQVRYATDSPESVRTALETSLRESDLVLVTGGVSVGDYDLVIPAALECGIQTLFHKIKQKPGKPLFFGRKEDKVLFGLPGNPSSALTCFYEYVLPFIETGMHIPHTVKQLKAKVEQAYRKPAGLTHFIKAIYRDGNVSVLNAQESYRLQSFAQSNCLLVLAEGTEGCLAGDIVDVHLLPV